MASGCFKGGACPFWHCHGWQRLEAAPCTGGVETRQRSGWHLWLGRFNNGDAIALRRSGISADNLAHDLYAGWPQILWQAADPGSNRRTPSDRFAGIVGGLLGCRAHLCWLPLQSLTQADHHRWSWLDIGPIREWDRHQNNGKASQHQAATIGSPPEKL